MTTSARSIQASHYYPFGSKNQAKPLPETSTEPASPSWNQQQAQDARDRIRQAVADLLSHNALPSQATARKNAIKAYGIGSETLKKHLELWHPDHLKPLPEAQSHPINDNKLVPTSAAPLGRADGTSKVGGCWGLSTATDPAVAATAKRVAKMQVWLESGDPILQAEAEQYFAAVRLAESVAVPVEAVDLEQQPCGPTEGVAMPGGFGVTQPKRRDGKTRSQAIRQLDLAVQSPAQKPQSDVVMQAEVEAFFAQYQQEHPEEIALAWSTGVYNPLANVDLLAVGARFLEPEEEDWLAIARMVEWLDVEDDLDAIYFTAPPPDFALEQADWYVRPDLTSFLEEPMLLQEVIQQYPIPLKEIQRAIAQRFLQLGWTSQQQKRFMLELFEKPQTELTENEWKFLLFELESQLQNET